MQLRFSFSPQTHTALARGVTLVELMVTLALIAVVASVAMPSYREHVRRSVRNEAQAYLMSVAARQQQFLLDTRAFAPDITTVGLAPSDRVAAAYALTMTVQASPTPSFKVVATPQATQAGERCGTLSVDQIGAKTADSAGCW